MVSRFVALALALVLYAPSSSVAVMAPMPFRPGYGLGSWIEPNVVSSMRQEGAFRSAALGMEQLANDMEAVAREIKMEAYKAQQSAVMPKEEDAQSIPPAIDEKTLKTLEDKLQKQRQTLAKKKVDNYVKLFDLQEKEIDAIVNAGGKDGQGHGDDAAAGSGGFTTFASSISSPIMWDKSNIVYKDRSFDSIQMFSNFVRAESNVEKDYSEVYGQHVASNATDSLHYFFGSGTIATSMSQQISHKVTNTFKQHRIEYTLILTSFATHRKVKQFDQVVTDVDALHKAWNYYQKDHIADPTLEKAKFAEQFEQTIKDDLNKKAGSHEEKISLVTEAYLGSCVVGLVHFVRMEDTTSSQAAWESEKSVEARLKISSWLDSFTGGTAFSSSAASKIAQLASVSGLYVHFDLTSLGYIPTLKSRQLEMAVKQFKDFDPAKFDAGASLSSSGQEGLSNAYGQGVQQSNMGSVVKATIMGISETEKNAVSVMDVNSFMDAFDDYAQAAKTMEGIGVPVGLNVKQWTKMDVYYELGNKYISPEQRERGVNPSKKADDEPKK